MDLAYVAAHGFAASDVALLVARVSVGMFFAISGFNKLFNSGRHKSIVITLEKDHVPLVPIMQWWVPGWEFTAGIMLTVGFMSAFAAGVLAIICIVACICEAKERVDAYKPINTGDRVADYLYLQEILYIILLSVNILAGTGRYSIDAIIWPIGA